MVDIDKLKEQIKKINANWYACLKAQEIFFNTFAEIFNSTSNSQEQETEEILNNQEIMRAVNFHKARKGDYHDYIPLKDLSPNKSEPTKSMDEHNASVVSSKQIQTGLDTIQESRPIILDNNFTSITEYLKEHPENWKRICEALDNSPQLNQPLVSGKKLSEDTVHKNCEHEVPIVCKGCGKKLCMDCGSEDVGHTQECSMGGIGFIRCGHHYDGQIMLCPKCKENAPTTWEEALPKTMAKGKEAYEKEQGNIHTEIKKEILKDYENT